MAKGIDYAWHGTINWSCLQSNGVTFICRYFSYDPSKDLSSSELQGAISHGIEVAVVWETTANRMLSGYNGGVSDAKESKNRANSLGINSIPIYFACDWDASESEQSAINSYLDGAVSILGKSRVGMYAGYWPLKRAFDAGKMTYGWQTYAWSGDNKDSRMHLYQYQNGITVCGLSADWDESKKTDFGQWPRPSDDSIAPPVDEIGIFMPASAYFNNVLHMAMIDKKGRVCYDVEGGQWNPVDSNQSGAKGGCDITISDAGAICITYINSNYDVCTYIRAPGGGPWVWANRGGDAQG